MNRLCTLCARGGSKGVPNKNLRPIAGKPLIAYSLLQARESGLFDHIAVSSDSQAILDEARRWGADLLVRRPAELATDECPKIPVIRHAVEEAERMAGSRCAVVVDLDATSPLRSVEDVRGCVRLLESDPSAANVITGTRARRSPYFNLIEEDVSGGYRPVKPLTRPIVRRQDAPRCYDMNASIYVWRRPALFAGETVFGPGSRLFEMSEETAVDVDTEFDWRIVEYLLAQRASAQSTGRQER
ncbi:MAG: CMP-N,N'-diacetyllegionaminic acid synthase [Candidatus Omnitrophica bacterium]|nr:CMP-N,N'-diacetyllegionaminic acid synthase [Candidatus Omnitrophota bacterium]